jgi:homoserine kinase type II
MALLTELPIDAARRLASAFGVDLVALEPLALGSVNSNFRARAADGRVLFLRLYEEQGQAGARSEMALLAALARGGVPVAEALPHGEELPEHAGKPLALFPWVEGEIRCSTGVTTSDARAVGAALARVHLASGAIDRLGPGRFGPDDMLRRVARVESEGGRPELAADLARIRAHYERLVPARDAALPSGVVHGDLFRDNVLFQDGRVVALLDFESAFHGPFVYDLMVTLAAFCYRSRFELDLSRAMVAGYVAERPLSAEERGAIRVEGALGCLRFAVSRITDFELRSPPGVPPARDYRRFLSRLDAIEGGALDEVFSALG